QPDVRSQPQLGRTQKERLIHRYAQRGREEKPPAVLADESAETALHPQHRHEADASEPKTKRGNERQWDGMYDIARGRSRRRANQNHHHHMEIRLEIGIKLDGTRAFLERRPAGLARIRKAK